MIAVFKKKIPRVHKWQGCRFSTVFGQHSQMHLVCCLTRTKHTHLYYTRPICSPVDLQIAAAAQVQLAPLQSTVEHIPCLCFLYRPIKIFPLMASLLQVGESRILCLDNELTPSSYCSSKYSINHNNALSSIPLVSSHAFNGLQVDTLSLRKSDLQGNLVLLLLTYLPKFRPKLKKMRRWKRTEESWRVIWWFYVVSIYQSIYPKTWKPRAEARLMFYFIEM